MKYFGTDGIRGIFDKDITLELAYRVGVALAQIKSNAKILIGRDTRFSGQILSMSFSIGAMKYGANIEDVEVCPTSGISYLTKLERFDYGVVISASHNSAEYNGIKIFNKFGLKIDEKEELKVEQLIENNNAKINNLGKYKINKKLINKYEKFLINNGKNLNDLNIVLDCANGASFKIAKKIFQNLGAKIKMLSCSPNGININKNCGSTHIANLINKVISSKANMGFAFDGDSDRVIAVDEKGEILDGDKIIYLMAKYYLSCGKLKNKCVVGTIITNSAIEKELKKDNIKLIRTNVGDKYINEELIKNNLMIGGEQCGHIIVRDKHVTGDGVLNAVLIASICQENNKKLSEFILFKNYNQTVKNINVENKNNILKCKKLEKIKKNIQNDIKNQGRILIRASGTENVIRIMVELDDEEKAKKILDKLEKIIKEIDGANN